MSFVNTKTPYLLYLWVIISRWEVKGEKDFHETIFLVLQLGFEQILANPDRVFETPQ